MVRSFTPSDSEDERTTKRLHRRKQSHSRSPHRSRELKKKQSKHRQYSHSRSQSLSPPRQKIKTEPESPPPRWKNKSEQLSPPRRKIKTEPESPPSRRIKTESESPPRRRVKTESESPPRRKRKHRHHHREEDDHGRHQQRREDDIRQQMRERRHHEDRRREHRRKNRNVNPFNQQGNPEEEFEYGQSSQQTDSKPKDKDKPDFKLSGKLTEDTNTYRGVVIKYNQPPEARKPKKRWRLYPFKGDESLPVLHIHRNSAYLIGRDRVVVDIPTDHPSCSKQHAVLQYRMVDFERDDGTQGRRVAPYIIDLGSSNGTYVNNQRIDPERYVELFEKDVLKFGYSTREYVLLHEKTDTREMVDEGNESDSN